VVPDRGAAGRPSLSRSRLGLCAESFKLSRAQRDLLKSRAERIAELGRELEADGPIAENGLPRSRSRLRNIAEMDDWDGIPPAEEEVEPTS
jgi:hypothetical protein